MSRRAVSLTLAALLLPLSGCGGGGSDDSSKPAAGTTDPSSSGKPVAASCARLSSADVTALAGRELKGGEKTDLAGLDTCTWGDPAKLAVQVVQAPAEDWVVQLPALIAQYFRSGASGSSEVRAKLQRGVQMVRSEKKKMSGDQACDLFSTLTQLQGRPAGSHEVTNLVPDKSEPHAVSAQQCVDGVFSSVTLISGPVLKKTPAIVKRAERARSALAGG